MVWVDVSPFPFQGKNSFFAPILVATPRMKELPYSLDPTGMKHGPTPSVVGFVFFSSWDLSQLMVNMVP